MGIRETNFNQRAAQTISQQQPKSTEMTRTAFPTSQESQPHADSSAAVYEGQPARKKNASRESSPAAAQLSSPTLHHRRERAEADILPAPPVAPMPKPSFYAPNDLSQVIFWPSPFHFEDTWPKDFILTSNSELQPSIPKGHPNWPLELRAFNGPSLDFEASSLENKGSHSQAKSHLQEIVDMANQAHAERDNPVPASAIGAAAKEQKPTRKAKNVKTWRNKETGERVAANTPGAVPQSTYAGRQRVDLNGNKVTDPTQKSISRRQFDRRNRRLKQKSGRNVPPSTLNSITVGAIQWRKAKKEK